MTNFKIRLLAASKLDPNLMPGKTCEVFVIHDGGCKTLRTECPEHCDCTPLVLIDCDDGPREINEHGTPIRLSAAEFVHKLRQSGHEFATEDFSDDQS